VNETTTKYLPVDALRFAFNEARIRLHHLLYIANNNTPKIASTLETETNEDDDDDDDEDDVRDVGLNALVAVAPQRATHVVAQLTHAHRHRQGRSLSFVVTP
jgi:hypothetical protein